MSNKLFQKAVYAGIGFACAYIERWYSMRKLKKKAFKDGYYCGFSHCKTHMRIGVKNMMKELPDITWLDEDLIVKTIDKVNGDLCWDTLIKSKTDS